MGIMLIPTVASLSEDAMSAVPRDLRQGAYALGSTRMQVSTRIVVPAAISGIIASLRAGDLARDGRDDDRPHRGRSCQPNLTLQPAEAVQTMTAFIAATAQR